MATTNYKLYTLCTLILCNPFHLTIGSKLIMNQNEHLVPKCRHANFQDFCLCLG
jgi:hypothetical protein